MGAHLDEELLAGGPLLPSKLARPGPVRAPSPPTGIKKCVLEVPPAQLGRHQPMSHVLQQEKLHILIPTPREDQGGLDSQDFSTGG